MEFTRGRRPGPPATRGQETRRDEAKEQEVKNRPPRDRHGNAQPAALALSCQGWVSPAGR